MRHHKKYKSSKELTEKRIFGWIVTSVVFTACFVMYFAHHFVANCIFEWPIRWDVGVCWNEQVDSAVRGASEVAVHFVP